MQRLTKRIDQLEKVAHRGYSPEKESAPWWMLFRHHVLWFDDDGGVIVTRDYEDDPGLQALAADMNRELTPGQLIILLTESEAQEALQALHDGRLCIRPNCDSAGTVYYYVGAPWRHPLASILNTAIRACNLRGSEPIMTTESAIDFLLWSIEQYATADPAS